MFAKEENMHVIYKNYVPAKYHTPIKVVGKINDLGRKTAGISLETIRIEKFFILVLILALVSELLGLDFGLNFDLSSDLDLFVLISKLPIMV